MYVCGNLIVTSDAKALTMCSSKNSVSFSNRIKEARPEDFVPNSERCYFRRDT